MRLLHLSDLHIGKKVKEFSLLEDQRYMLEQVLGIIKERKVDALLVAGDVYDRSSPSSDAVAVVDWFFDALAQMGTPVFVCAGNHDSPERIAYGANLFARQGVYVSPVFDGTLAHHTLADEHGAVTFWLIPFLNKATVQHFYPDAAIDSYTDALACAIDAAGVDATQRNVALSHQFVTAMGIQTELGGSEMSVGGLDNVDVSVYDPFDYVALGHIHRAQRLGRDTVRYSGSLLKYHAQEIPYARTAPLIELGAKGNVTYELVPLAPLHDMRAIKGPLERLVAPETVALGDALDYICATVTDESPALDYAHRLRGVYPNLMQVTVENTSTQAAGLQGDVARIEALEDLRTLFDTFFSVQNGRSMTEAETDVLNDAFKKAQVM